MVTRKLEAESNFPHPLNLHSCEKNLMIVIELPVGVKFTAEYEMSKKV